MATECSYRRFQAACLAGLLGGAAAWTPASAAELVGRITLPQSGRLGQQAMVDPYRGALGSLANGGKAPALNDPRDIVVTLEGAAEPATGGSADNPQMEQINQSFQPRVLAVPVGTVVDFPNLDPIFHNAFSYSKAKTRTT